MESQYTANFRLLNVPEAMKDVADAVKGPSLIAVDLETTAGHPRFGTVRLISYRIGNRQPVVVDMGMPMAVGLDNHEDSVRALMGLLSGHTLLSHNAAFEASWWLRYKAPLPKVWHCTMLAAQVASLGTGPVYYKPNLGDVLIHYLGDDGVIGKDAKEAMQKSDWTGFLTMEQRQYAADDVRYLLQLYGNQMEDLCLQEQMHIYNLEREFLPAVASMTLVGVPFVQSVWLVRCAAAKAAMTAAVRELDERYYPKDQLPGLLGSGVCRKWLWSSHDECLKALQQEGYHVENTADATLALLPGELPRLLREYREHAQLVKMYGPDWPMGGEYHMPGRIFPRWSQIGARGGRMSAARPNLTQIPRDPGYRCAVTTAGTNRLLAWADYSQIELRIVARLSGDERMLAVYQEDRDIHEETARAILHRPVGPITKEERSLAKAVNFGLIYGMKPQGLRVSAACDFGVQMSLAEASEFCLAYFEHYAGLSKWQYQQNKGVYRSDIRDTVTLVGRRRKVNSNNQALNAPVQGTGADLIKRAATLAWQRLCGPEGVAGENEFGFPVRLVGVIHDEILLECGTDDYEAAGVVARQLALLMEWVARPYLLPVPVKADAAVGMAWNK